MNESTHHASEFVLAILLVALAAILVDPYWMPMGAIYTGIVIFIITLGGFAAFVWRERGGDERDALIRHVAARASYTTAAVVMAVGIVWQVVTAYAADPWLVGAFIATVLAKAIGFMYAKGRY